MLEEKSHEETVDEIVNTFTSEEFLQFAKSILYNITIGSYKQVVNKSSLPDIREFLLNPKNENVCSFLLGNYTEGNTDVLKVVAELKKDKKS